MSSASADFLPQRRWMGKKGLLLLCGAIGVLLIIAWIILTLSALRRVPALAGRVSIKGNPEVRIYVGDKLFTNGNVSLSWDELFGDNAPERMSVEVGPESDKGTVETVAGPGAHLLQQTTAGGGSTNIVDFNMLQYLLRRPDGKLDQLLVLLLDLQPANDLPRRFVVPIRARSRKNGSAVFLGGNCSVTVTSRAPFLKLFGQSPSELSVFLTINPAKPPDQFAQEIEEKGLWEPSGNPSGKQE